MWSRQGRLGYHAAIRPGLGAHVTQRLVVTMSGDGVPVLQHRRARLVTRLALRDVAGLHMIARRVLGPRASASMATRTDESRASAAPKGADNWRSSYVDRAVLAPPHARCSYAGIVGLARRRHLSPDWADGAVVAGASSWRFFERTGENHRRSPLFLLVAQFLNP